MSKFILKSILLFCLMGLLSSCFPKAKEKAPVKRKNYIIVLDLSDRILTHGQVKHDQAIIEYLLTGFLNRTRQLIVDHHKDFNVAKDQIKIVVADQKGGVAAFDPVFDKLFLNLKDTKKGDFKFIFDKQGFEKSFQAALQEVYQKSRFSGNPADYSGAELYKFFKEDLATMLDYDSLSENYVFVMTDGYFDFEAPSSDFTKENRFTSTTFYNQLRAHKHAWRKVFQQKDYGLQPVNFSKPHHLKVAVLEVNPKYAFEEEYQLISATWSKWLLEMGLKPEEFMLVKKQAFSSVKQEVDQFLGGSSSSSSLAAKHGVKPSVSSANVEQKVNSSAATTESTEPNFQESKTQELSVNIKKKLNLLASSSLDEREQVQVRQELLSAFSSGSEQVTVLFPSGKLSGRFSMEDYLFRIQKLNYRITSLSLETNSEGELLAISVKEEKIN